MMKRIFLGPWLHWLILAIVAGLAWLAGGDRLHVTHFNTFVGALIAISVIAVALVLRSSAQGARVTRDPIEDERDD